MSNVLQQEQQMIADSARRWATQTGTTAQREQSAAHAHGCPPERWSEIAAMGWLAFSIPAEDEGLGGSLRDQCLLAQELGRALLIEPFIASAVIASDLLVQCPPGALRSEWLTAMAQGERRLALALWEPQYEGMLSAPHAQARPSEHGWLLDGAKGQSPGLSGADALLVLAQLQTQPGQYGQCGLFLVSADAPGLRLCDERLYDGRHAASASMESAPATLLLAADAQRLLAMVQRALDRGIVAHCAETAGAASVALETTLDYVKTRKQFGRSISSNQVVQHRLVDLFVEIEELKAFWWLAASEPTARHVSALMIRCADVARHVWEETLQLHGAIGMTEEYQLGEYLRRLALAASLYGSAALHQERLAAMAFNDHTQD